MDKFDTPTVMDARVDKDPVAMSQLKIMMDRLTAAPDATGHLLVRPATAWKRAAERRDEARSEDALTAIRNANKAYLDAMRDLRRDRRAFEKARDEVKWWNVFNGERRAARIVARDTAAVAREARNARREARRSYPLSLPQFAIRCHAAHAAPATLWAGISNSTASGVALWLSATAIGLNYAVVKLGMRHVVADTATDVAVDGPTPSQEERDLLQRLDPTEWQRVAAPRGLSDVVASGATLTESGIQAKLTLNGTMDVPTLQRKIPQLRAALRLREGTRLELREGKTGGHARLTLRTRSASAGVDMTGWWPGAPWAVNTVTGETVATPLGKRLLVAGTSGSGKSWSARPLMAEASEYEDNRLVIFDRKYVEARTWEHRARVVSELDEMDALCDELEAEGEARLKTLPRGRDTIDISPSYPRITVFVDEGGELISDCVGEYESVITRLRTIARKYRAAEIILVWATQKPSMSGKGYGIDSQIAGQMQDRVCLAVTTPTESRVMFGENAADAGWKADELPMPGFALYKQLELGNKSVPQMLQMRAMSPQQVIDLPSRPIWSRQVSSTGATKADIEARMQLETAGDPWADVLDDSGATVPLMKKPRVSAEDRDDQICEELSANPCQTISALAKAIGASKSVVKNRLEQMAADGLVAKDDDGCWHCVS